MKLAILNLGDTHFIESFHAMFAYAGYETKVPGLELCGLLKGAGLPLVLHWSQLSELGYLEPNPPIEDATISDFYNCDLFADPKVNGCRILLDKWPQFKGRVLWTRIQGGKYEITLKGGDEIDLPCPTLTSNLWYRDNNNFNGMAYVCWPPFCRAPEYHQPRSESFTNPVCLTHGASGWGYGKIIEPLRKTIGLKVHGTPSPDGCIPNSQVPDLLRSALCYIQLRSNDSPGAACSYEAMSSGCPVVVPRRFIERMRVQELYVEGETCLCFDTPDGECHSDEWASACVREIVEHVARLRNVVENRRFGEAARKRIAEVMWNVERDGESFKGFIERHFS